MNYFEKIDELEQMIEELGIDPESKEGKILDKMTEILEEMSDQIEGLVDHVDAAEDLIENIEDAFNQYEDNFYPDDEDEDGDGEDPVYCVECPECGEEIVIEEDALALPNLTCPACGAEFTLEIPEYPENDDEE